MSNKRHLRFVVGANDFALLVTVFVAAVGLLLIVKEQTPDGTPYMMGEPIALGAFSPASGESTTDAPWNPEKLNEFTSLVGTPPHIVSYYQNWEQTGKKYFDPAKLDAVIDSNATPMVTWASRDPTKGAKQRKYADKNIVSGRYDDYITQWADAARDWGKFCQAKHQFAKPCAMYLRFGHEMNDTRFPWSPGVNGNTTADFINAWRHVRGIFTKEGATNVLWVWSPSVDCGRCTPFASVYPGDDYVDWVALDGFNWGTSKGWSSWQTVAQVFGPSYDQITTQVAPSKPFMIAEISSAEAGGDKAKWIEDAFSTDPIQHPESIPNRMPKTKAVVWFSADKTQAGETDWRVNSSPASLSAYKTVAASSAYQGLLPSP